MNFIKTIDPFLELPLWLSIPLIFIYLAAWVSFFYTLYHFGDWRQHKPKKEERRQQHKQQHTINKSDRDKE